MTEAQTTKPLHPATLAANRARLRIDRLNRLLATRDFGPDGQRFRDAIETEIAALRQSLARGLEECRAQG